MDSYRVPHGIADTDDSWGITGILIVVERKIIVVNLHGPKIHYQEMDHADSQRESRPSSTLNSLRGQSQNVKFQIPFTQKLRQSRKREVRP